MRKVLTLIMCSVLLLGLAGTAVAKEKVRIAYVEWDCAVASTNMVKAVLEQEMGYEVEILPVAAAAMWQATASGDVEGMVTAWLPVTHGDYLEKVGDKVEDLGPIVGGAKVGWVVPSYVNIDSIEQLKANADKFDGEIVGIDPGAGLMRMSEETMEAYELGRDFELMEGSGATMTAALSNAIKKKEWIVATGWSPHWMFGRWDLKYLEDPKGTLGGEETINTIVRQGLEKDMPEVYAFLNNFHWKDPGQMQMVMAWNQDRNTTPAENAKRFIKEHPEMVELWLKK